MSKEEEILFDLPQENIDEQVVDQLDFSGPMSSEKRVKFDDEPAEQTDKSNNRKVRKTSTKFIELNEDQYSDTAKKIVKTL